MTYEEKYTELHNNFSNAGKRLQKSIDELDEINGFFDKSLFDNYFKAYDVFNYHKNKYDYFNHILKNDPIDPKREFIEHEFMYQYIRDDQIKKGIVWGKLERIPIKTESFDCEISLTNDDQINTIPTYNVYKFPVLNLDHGLECIHYLCKQLMDNSKAEIKLPNRDKFPEVVREKPIYISITIQIRQR